MRVLLELLEMGKKPSITNRECVEALMPIRTNSDWALGLAELIEIRKSNRESSSPIPRYIQEWFALLGSTDLFIEEKIKGRRGDTLLSLSSFALENKPAVQKLCELHESADNFWIPPQNADKNVMGDSWFAYYGTPTLENQWVLPESELTSEYINDNYLAGMEFAEDEGEITVDYQEWAETINLRPFEKSNLSAYDTRATPSENAINNFVQGYAKRQAKTLFHDQIVEMIAKRLISAGFSVHEDRKSVDLLASREREESILEIIQVNRSCLTESPAV